MASTINVNGAPIRLYLAAFGAPPQRNRLPMPAGVAPTWAGFNDAVARHEMSADNLSVMLFPLSEGTLHITATIEGYMPAPFDVTVGPEKVDHFEIVVE